ncbi:MAG: L,D-transpeptidase [Anaerolineae bacterium]|nr:L,D-transpeptidase [Anaerolineae bacterium]
MPVTRRHLLKLITATATMSVLAPALHARAQYPEPPGWNRQVDYNAWVRMGRAIHPLTFYEEPSTSAKKLTTLRRDQSFLITGEVHAPFTPHNDLWYETPLGYVHSAWVLPVRVYPPQPFIRDVGEWGFWGEIAQVFTEAYEEPDLNSRKVYRFYGGNVFHVVGSLRDERGVGWYKVYDEFPPTSPSHQWVLAKDVRRIPRSEMTPIRPFVGKKRIEINLDKQQLDCYEGDELVFSTKVSSGLPGLTATPTGEMCVILKQPSRHMSNRPYPGGPPPLGDIFDLPGVPWNLFFDLSGTAIHGTYWHNDFGVRRSHGCVNVSQEVARWLYRWSHPIAGYEDDFVQSTAKVGTPIIIF